MSRFWRACFLGFVLLPFAAAHAATPQATLDEFAKSLGYHSTILSSKVTESCPAKPAQQYRYFAALNLAHSR